MRSPKRSGARSTTCRSRPTARGARRSGSPRCCEASALSRRDRLRRTRRGPRVLGALRRRRSDRAVAADLDDHPLALLEGADPLPRAALPRGDLRSPGERAIRQADGTRGIRRARVRGGCARGDGRDRDRSERCSYRSQKGHSGRCCWPPTIPSAFSPPPSSRRSSRSVRSAVCAGASWPIHDFGRRLFIRPPVAAGWLKFNGAHWLADYPDFVEWWMRRIFNTPHSTKQIEDAIGWALETDAEDADRQRPRRPRRAGDAARSVGVGPPSALSGAGHLRAQRQDHRSRRRQGARQGNRR